MVIQQNLNLIDKSISLLELNSVIADNVKKICSYWIRTRINSITKSSIGHIYLDLIEADETGKVVASIKANIWRNNASMIDSYFELETGSSLQADMDILVQVDVAFHAVYGICLNIKDIEPSYTVGLVEVQKQKVINQLTKDGVVDMNKRLALTILPQRLAIISSLQAAGYQDFLHHLTNNQYGFAFHCKLFEAQVQGDQAEKTIIEALDRINEHRTLFDAVVIVRGGGAKLDLSCFDLYNLCSNIANFPLPVITGIGHERDTSVADIVAHTRAKTPTAAAEFLIDKVVEQAYLIEELKKNLKNSFSYFSQNQRFVFKTIKNKILNVLQTKIESQKSNLIYNTIILKNAINKTITESRNLILKQKTTINLLNPHNILMKGYTIQEIDGKIVKRVSDISSKITKMKTYFSDGIVLSQIIEKKTIDNNQL